MAANLNTICFRISYILILVLVGGIGAVGYFGKVVTPLAVAFLPTETADAHLANSYVAVITKMNSGEQRYEYKISYAGHTAKLIAKKPLVPFVSEDEIRRRDEARIKQLYTGRAPAPEPPKPEPTIPVRFVSAVPSFVVHEVPNASLGDYYNATWTGGEVFGLVIWAAIVLGVAFLLWRNLTRSRRRHRR